MPTLAATELQADRSALGRLLGKVNLAGLAIGVSGLALPLGWVSASFAVALGLAAFSAFIVRGNFPRWSTNLYVFGLLAGWVELLADHWLVHGTRTLVYAEGGPFVLASPLYMPWAWAGLLTSSTLLGVQFAPRVPLWVRCAAMAVIVGTFIPLYEGLAHASGWWHYRETPMLGGIVPYFIVLGEAATGALLPWLGQRLERTGLGGAALLGSGLGLWIFASYAAAYWLVGVP